MLDGIAIIEDNGRQQVATTAREMKGGESWGVIFSSKMTDFMKLESFCYLISIELSMSLHLPNIK